jgi:hypothetical protein
MRPLTTLRLTIIPPVKVVDKLLKSGADVHASNDWALHVGVVHNLLKKWSKCTYYRLRVAPFRIRTRSCGSGQRIVEKRSRCTRWRRPVAPFRIRTRLSQLTKVWVEFLKL